MTPGAVTPPGHGDAGRERGFALLLVLWTMVLLALLGTRLAASARTEAALAANVRDAALTQAAADGAVQEAAFHLLEPPPRQWPVDGAPHVLALPGVVVDLRVTAEEGKVNPNLASPELLAALLREAGADTATAGRAAAGIAAWRFPGADRDPATIRAYRAAGLDYLPSGQPFRTTAELGGVLGMTPALLARLSPFLSVHTTSDPDLAQAAPTVLAALRATGAARPAPEPRVPTLVAVTAVAAGPNGTRFTRRAVLRLLRTGSGSPGMRVLEWSDG